MLAGRVKRLLAHGTSRCFRCQISPKLVKIGPWSLIRIYQRLDIFQELDRSGFGLFQNFKQASKQMTKTIDQKLHERYPGIKTTLFDSTDQNVNVIETDLKDEFIKWADGIDAAILLVGN